MANDYFQFKQFLVRQNLCAMKVCTDSCILGAFAAQKIEGLQKAGAGPKTVLDIGGGTGLLSLMIAQKSQSLIEAVELDASAAEQMKDNFKKSPWHGRLLPRHSGIQSFESKQYDFIISNPPFYENSLAGSNHTKILAHHDTGLLLSELVAIISQRLLPNKHFCIMVPFARQSYLTNLLTENNLRISEIIRVSHSANHPPFRTIVFGSNFDFENGVKITNFIIHNYDNSYTEDFKNLLKDYYLHL